MKMNLRRRHRNADGQLAARADDVLAGVGAFDALTPEDPSAERHEVAEQVRIAALIRAVDVAAPPSLHRSVAALTAANPAGPARHTAGWSPARRSAIVAASAVLAVIAVVVIAPGGGSSPTVAQAAQLTLRPATAPPPRRSTDDPARLTVSMAGIAYPNLAYRFGWHATGLRTDTLDGRATTTVFYTSHTRQRIGYEIVGGTPLPLPGSSQVRRDSIRYRLLRVGNATVVTWRRAGHTCVLSGTGVATHALLALASWSTP